MMKKILFYLLPVLVLTSCGEDDNVNASHPSTTPGENIGEIPTLPQAPTEIYEAVDQSLQVYFNSLNTEDYETHVDMAYPGIFDTEDERIYMIETLSDWGKKGLKNYAHNVKLDYITPGVQLDTTMAYAAFFIGDFKVDFEDHYEGDPMSFKNQINGAFTRFSLEYDSVKTEFNGHGVQMVYAITSENNLDFKFVNERFVGTDRMGGIIDFDNMKRLKSYESAYNNK